MRDPRSPEKIASEAPRAPQRKRIRTNRDPAYDVAFGARIRAARIAAKVSQTALGAALGISFQQVQKYESGKDRVTVSALHRIATALGVHPGSFFDESVPVPTGSIPDLNAAFRAADVLGQIRDRRVLSRLIALGKVLADSTGSVTDVESTADETDEGLDVRMRKGEREGSEDVSGLA